MFHGLVRRFSHLRQFSPVLLRALEFFPDAGDGDVPCLEALRVLKEMNADLKRKLPEDAPTDFIPKRLLPFVVTDGKPDRKAWECALLLKLQDDLRSGNLSVKHGKRFGRFEDYFLPKERWEPLRKSFFQRSGLPADPKDVPDHLTKRLNTAYDLFLKTAPDNSYATVDERRLASVHGRRRDVGRRGPNAAGRPEAMADQADAHDPAPGPAHRGR